MKITIIGTGYVGLVTGTCFAEMGTSVICVDNNRDKIEKLKKGIMPIYEPGLEELVKRNVDSGRLRFSESLKDSINGAELIFSAVGTPPAEDGSADLKYVMEVAREVGKHAADYFVFVTKSTVPVGASVKMHKILKDELTRRGLGDMEFDIASNPEFLKEGNAIKDFMGPDRVVIGTESERARNIMERLYKPFTLNGYPIMFMDIASAEMTKYAANCMLATRISFMNEVANLCEQLGANIDLVRKGIGSDPRIGSKFLYAGAGYGGSCFPKDVKAMAWMGEQIGCDMSLLRAVDSVNRMQKLTVFRKIKDALGDNHLSGKVIAVWGLSYKPETDDMREAPSIDIIENLLAAGAVVRAFDPIAMQEAKKVFGERIIYCDSIYETALEADAVALVTEWKQFRIPSWGVIKKAMRGNILVDGRNIYDPEEMKAEGFRYSCIGKKTR